MIYSKVNSSTHTILNDTAEKLEKPVLQTPLMEKIGPISQPSCPL